MHHIGMVPTFIKIKHTFMRFTVFHTGNWISESVVVAFAASIVKFLTPHGGHVEEVSLKECPTRALILPEPAGPGNL